MDEVKKIKDKLDASPKSDDTRKSLNPFIKERGEEISEKGFEKFGEMPS